MMGLYDMMDIAIADELGVVLEVYTDVIENKCTHWEMVFIIGAMWDEEREDRKLRAKNLFMECQSR
jgi:hypothetical protein